MAKQKYVTPDVYTAKEAMSPDVLRKAKGYDVNFFGKLKPLTDDLLSAKNKKQLPVIDGKAKGRLNYTNLSVYYNSQRRVPFYSAYNINLSLNCKNKRTTFKTDDRIDTAIQLNKDFYDLKPDNDGDFDIGHMAASDEMSWGKDGQKKSLQTFFFPNTCPQAYELNEHLWNTMEQKLITAQTGKKEGKLCVFTGPILNNNDPYYTEEPTFQLPMRFFKVFVFEYNKQLHCTAMIMSHVNLLKELDILIEREALERFVPVPTPIDDFPHKGIYQVSMKLLKKLSGINFTWANVKPIAVREKDDQMQRIDALETPDDIKNEAGRESFVPSAVSVNPNKTASNPFGFCLAK